MGKWGSSRRVEVLSDFNLWHTRNGNIYVTIRPALCCAADPGSKHVAAKSVVASASAACFDIIAGLLEYFGHTGIWGTGVAPERQTTEVAGLLTWA
jgi:hypothetical protein